MDSGDIQLSDVTGFAKLQTHNKDIDAENVAGQLDVIDSHGDVKIVYANPPRDALDVTNDSGEVDVTLPGRSSFQISAFSRSFAENDRRGKRRTLGRPIRDEIRSACPQNHNNNKLRHNLVAQIFLIRGGTGHGQFARLLLLCAAQTIECRKKLRKRNPDAFGIPDGRIPFRAERRDR